MARSATDFIALTPPAENIRPGRGTQSGMPTEHTFHPGATMPGPFRDENMKKPTAVMRAELKEAGLDEATEEEILRMSSTFNEFLEYLVPGSDRNKTWLSLFKAADDNDSDSNSANVGLAVIRQSVAFPLKASVKKQHHAHACYSITIRGKDTAPTSSLQSVHSPTSSTWSNGNNIVS